MAATYPASLDAITVPSGSTTLGGGAKLHTELHQWAVDAVQALEKFGVPCYNIKTYGGAKGDKRSVSDGATSTNTTLTSATAAFTSADVGKVVRIAKASTSVAMPLTATISSRTNGTTVVLDTAADFTVSGKTLVIDGPTGRKVVDGASTAGSTTITSATAVFVAGDVGSQIELYEAAAPAHVTTIASVTNGTTVVLAAASTRTVTGVAVTIQTNDSAAVQACLDAANSAGGGAVIVPFNNVSYGVADLNLYGNTMLLGVGEGGSRFEYLALTTATWLLSVNSGSGGTTSVANNEKNISISGINFVGPNPVISSGPINTMGTAQNNHLLNLNAVSDVWIQNCKFNAWLGDAVYIGSSNSGATERHNERVRVLNCTFDGTNKTNRNAISIIDGDDILIQGNFFRRTTRPDMPGAVDIEPNNPTAAYPVTRNIRILDNVFDDIGAGIAGAISINPKTAQSSLTVPARGFYISRNHFINCGAKPLFVQNSNGAPTYSVLDNDIWFTDNVYVGKGDGYAFEIDKGVRGVHILRNKFENTFGGAQIGASGTIYDLEVEDNIFQSVGNAAGFASGGTNSALTVYQTQGLTIERNTFINCGDSAGGLGYVISFYTPGGSVSSDDTTIHGNKVLQGGSTRTTKFIHKHASHTATNVKGDMNDDLGLTRDIPLVSTGNVSYRALAADATTNSTTTAAKITGLDVAVPPGTWYFKYMVRYQAGATTTGVKFSVNHTGTVTAFVANMMYVDAAATAATGAPSQAANASTAQVFAADSARAKSAAAGMGPTLSVDVANADMLMIIEGTMVVTATGNIELWHASEVAAASTVKAGTILELARAA